jgi:hypothetical protein
MDSLPGRTAFRWRPLLLGFAVFTAIGTLSCFYHFFDDLTRGIGGTFAMRALEEYTAAYALALLFPLVAWLARRWPLRRGRRGPALAAYVLALPLFGAAHTTLMLVSRTLLAPRLGLGSYDYGNLAWRYPMEFGNQVIIFAVMVGAMWAWDTFQENRRRELTAARLREQLARAQLDNLRLQLQPHFLFNALNTISQAMYESVERADAMLARLSELLRHALAAGDGAQLVPLRQELDTSRLYLELEQARFEDKLQVEMVVAEEAAAAMVPHFLLQPLLENAVRHGGGRVELRAERHEDELWLEVRNALRHTAAPLPGHGVGLANTRERLEHLYGPAHRFEAVPEAAAFAVRMRLPWREAP